MTYRELSRTERETRLDRESWATIAKVGFDVLVKGSGEFLMDEPIMFGRAFEYPPFFTYSAAFRSSPIFSDVRAVGVPTNGVNPVAGTRGHSLLQDQFFPDGSFEHQMIWSDPVIPHWSSGYSRYQKIAAEQTGTSPWSTDRNNWWVQEPAKGQWQVSSDVSWVRPFGYPSRYSAKYVFGQNPSPKLVPFYAFENQPEPFYGGEPPEVGIWSHKFQFQPDYPPVFQAPAWNPRQGEFRYVIRTFSESEFDLEVTAVPFYKHPTNGSYQELKKETRTFAVEPGKWNEFTMDWSLPFEVEPNHPFTGNSPLGEWLADGWVRVEIVARNGTSGQAVYVDEVEGQPRLRPTSLPLLTVGVAEWVQDEQGMYVGAKLWFKLGTEDYVPPVAPPPKLPTT